jgi:chondroitin 4-sulfotransferase 11
MISHEYRFIFVHAGRTGGSSLERMAGIGTTADERTRHLGNTDFFEKHKDFQYFKTKYPSEFVDYFKFTLVRNPFDRLVSAWLWRTTVVKDIPLMTLKDFIESRPAYTRFSEKFKLDGLSIRDSIRLFDYIGRYEDLSASLKYLQEKLKLPGMAIPHVNQTHMQGYQEYYDPETIAVVREKFGEDLELFGYDF